MTLKCRPSLFAIREGEICVSPVVTAVDFVMIDGESSWLNYDIISHTDSTVDDFLLGNIFAPENNRLWEGLTLPDIRALLLVEDRSQPSAGSAAHVELLRLRLNVVVDNFKTKLSFILTAVFRHILESLAKLVCFVQNLLGPPR